MERTERVDLEYPDILHLCVNPPQPLEQAVDIRTNVLQGIFWRSHRSVRSESRTTSLPTPSAADCANAPPTAACFLWRSTRIATTGSEAVSSGFYRCHFPGRRRAKRKCKKPFHLRSEHTHREGNPVRCSLKRATSTGQARKKLKRHVVHIRSVFPSHFRR